MGNPYKEDKNGEDFSFLIALFEEQEEEAIISTECTLEIVADTFVVGHPVVPQVLVKYDDFWRKTTALTWQN